MKKINQNVLALFIVVTNFFATAVFASSTTYYVSPNGNDFSAGDQQSNPLETINQALELAQAGDTIQLLSGEYFQDIKTTREGTSKRPIRIIGSSGVVVKGAGNTSIVDIRHSYVELDSFTIDGLVGDGSQAEDYRKKLVYIKGRENRDIRRGERGIFRVKLLNMKILNARDECVRLKYFARYIEIANSHISHCGAEDFLFNGGGLNGEVIYIGTAPEQLDKNPTNEIDHSDNNWIHNNILESFGNECVDVKEGSSFNLIEYNQCSEQKDPKAGGVSIRGNQNIVRYNTIYRNEGAGVRLGGDTSADGIYNDVYGNQLISNQLSALKIMVEPQGRICDNIINIESGQKAIITKAGIEEEQFLYACSSFGR